VTTAIMNNHSLRSYDPFQLDVPKIFLMFVLK